MVAQTAVVALTDQRWFDFLRARAIDGWMDEVNFWRPLSQTRFRSLSPGEPFFFRLKSPINSIGGYGFFAHATRVPLILAWEAFGEKNGDPTFGRFLARIAEYRHESPAEAAIGAKELTCLILRDVRFFAESEWVPWAVDRGWRREIVAYKSYDLSLGDGILLGDLIRNGGPAELSRTFQPVLQDDRLRAAQLIVAREGQGAFRIRVLDAYGRRCAVTGERAIPTLDAAHIQPYLGPVSNHVQNGLALRADIHRLYDAGYVTVTPDYRFDVSRRLKDEFDNGELYFRLAGQRLAILPDEAAKQPSLAALEWHASSVFR